MNINFQEMIMTHQVEKGQKFKSYTALCAYIGIPVTTGKQRQLDQRYLQHYFTWEKVDGSHQLIITETFYDAPKPFEDGRQGIHTTELGEMMQKLFLQVQWPPKGLSKRELLIMMGLRSRQDMHNLETTAYWDFTQKQYSLLRSVFTQLQKKDALVMVEGLLDISTEEMLSERESAIYDDIFEATLKKHHASNIAFIYKEKLQEQFWLDVNRETWKRMERGRLKKACKILRTTHVFNERVSAEECMNAIAKKLCDRYSAKHKGALGNLSPETYQKEMQQVILHIQDTNPNAR